MAEWFGGYHHSEKQAAQGNFGTGFITDRSHWRNPDISSRPIRTLVGSIHENPAVIPKRAHLHGWIWTSHLVHGGCSFDPQESTSKWHLEWSSHFCTVTAVPNTQTHEPS